MALVPNIFGSTYHSLEKASPPTTTVIAANSFAKAFAKYLETSQAGDAPCVPAALYSPAAQGPFISALTAAFKSPAATALLPAIDLAITAYLTTACLQGLYVSPVSGIATAFVPTIPLLTLTLPKFVVFSKSGLAAKTALGRALQEYLAAGQVAFPGPPPVVRPIV